MIKKCLGILCTLGLILLPSFSSAYSYKQDFDIPDTFVKGNMTYTILNKFNVSTFYQNTTLNHILFSESNLSANQRNRLHSFFAWYDGKPYLYADYVHDGHRDYVYQGFPTQFCLATAGSGGSVCVPSSWSCPKNTDISVFYNAGNLTHGTFYGYGDFNSTYQVWTYCVSDNVNDYCFNISADSYYCGISYLTGSLNVSGTSIQQLQAIDWGSSPLGFNTPTYGDDVSSINILTGDYIDYYEDHQGYKFKPYMCYIGTNDLSSNYESGIAYYQGSGYTIYDFYKHLYGDTFKLTDFDTWLNSWLVNYDTFFNGNNRFADGSPRYVLRYNGIGNLQIDYTNLTNPFLNNKVAYYFLGSTVCDGLQGYYSCSDLSQELAIYCYKKTDPTGNITFNPDSGLQDNVNQWVVNKYNTNKWYSSGNWVVESKDWDGTTLDYFSGDSYGDFNSFFDNSFNKFKNFFGQFDISDLFLGQIPSYIVAFLLAIIFFKFLMN